MSIIFAAMIFAGIMVHQENVAEQQAVQTAAKAQRVSEAEAKAQAEAAKTRYARGNYIPQDGYYISNLSPAPVAADGCDMPVLTSDLSQPRVDENVAVTSVKVGCQ